MAQMIKQGDIFGRVGSGLGKGLAEQLPKEIERGRLQQGLSQFEKDASNLSPMQQIARLSAIPGITPQTIQSMAELARYQNQGNAFRNLAGQPPNGQQQASPQGGAQGIRDVQFGQRPGMQGQRPRQQMPSVGQVDNQQRTPNQNPSEDVPPTGESNAFDPNARARDPWTLEQRAQRISELVSNYGFTPDMAQKLAAEDEARYLQGPDVVKKRQEDISAARTKAHDALDRQLGLKLEKNPKDSPEFYKDVKGTMLLAAQRGMERDLILNPQADIENVANDWSDRLYQTAVAKGKLNKLGRTTGIENFFKGDKTNKELSEYQDIFKRSGNLEEFNDILQGPSFGMSANAAPSIAFPPNSKINKYISNHKYSFSGGSTPLKPKEARKAAIEVAKDIEPDDSIHAIANAFMKKDPNFDKQAFYDQISEDKDRIGLNERQRRELAEGSGNILPNWADLLYLPAFWRSK